MRPEEIPEWIPFLKRSILFRDLVAEDLEKLALRLQPLSLPKGATLYSRGEPGNSFYLIASGQVRLLAERGGREVVTAFLGRGDSLGEISLLTGEPRAVTVRLDTSSEFLVLSKKDFEEVVRETPSILVQLSRMIAQRMLTAQNGAPQPVEGQAVDRQELVMIVNALEAPARALLTMHLALAVVEQTRRRVLLVDMSPETGAVAKAMGLKPVLTSEAMLREQDLRDPAVLRNLVSEHPSGLEVMSLPSLVLGGRLYRGIFLLMNLLRESHDFVLVAAGRELGDVEKSILEEADQWVLLGSAATAGAFRALELEMGRIAPQQRRTVKVWVGSPETASAPVLHREGAVTIPWSDELAAQYGRGVSPYQVLDQHPKTRRGIDRLARRIAALLAADQCVVHRRIDAEGTDRPTDIRPYLRDVQWDASSARLAWSLAVTPAGTARPGELLAALGIEPAPWIHRVVRERIEWDETDNPNSLSQPSPVEAGGS